MKILPLLVLLLSSPESVTLPGATRSSLERPPGAGSFPAVVLVDGWWAESPFETSAAQRLVSAGFVVLRVALDRGPRPADRDVMHLAMASPPGPAAKQTLEAAVRSLRARKDVRGVTLAGARMGGRDVLHAADAAGADAAVSWYGTPPAGPGRTPALAFFGGQDFGPSLADARRFESASLGSRTEVHVYPDAAHGFAEPGNPWGGWDEKTAEDSWARALAFLRKQVPAPR